MVATFHRAGLQQLAPAGSFPQPSERSLGNQLPSQLGTPLDQRSRPGPHPASQPMGGEVGVQDGNWGSDPSRPKLQPSPWSTWISAWGEGSVDGSTGPGLTYGGGVIRDPNDNISTGAANADRLGRTWGNPLPVNSRPSWWRGGIQGFNDRLTVKDRHAYWDTGYQRTGVQGFPPAGSPNTYNDPLHQPPTAELRTVNRTVSYQKGTDTSRFQDDLSRPYTWLGEQGSGWSTVYGGVPGLYEPYGTRGGVPYPVVDPTSGQGGREVVWSGPPHGLHSLTYPDMGDTLDRYRQNVQMRPVRIDRPSNSPISGQAYSQTVEYQGSTQGAGQAGTPGTSRPGPQNVRARGWAGAQRPDRRGR